MRRARESRIITGAMRYTDEGEATRRSHSGAISEQEQPRIAKIEHYRQLNRNYTEAEKTVGALREENFTLREELRRRGVSASVIRELLQELQLSRYQASQSSQLYEVNDEFQWFNEIDKLYQPLDTMSSAQIVRTSYMEIMENVQCLPGAFPVFGWNDRRYLDGSIANFMFDKVIQGKSVGDLMQKTWVMSTGSAQMRFLQPKTQRMKVLQVLDENTLVIARQSYFPAKNEYHCNVYVLFRVERLNHSGFVVGTHTIDSYKRTAMLKDTQCLRHLFTRLVYTFMFEPSTAGTLVRFGGRVDNVREQHARNCLMDVILAILRWETHCVTLHRF